MFNIKLTNSQENQLRLLSDSKWHNVYNKGIKGLKHNSLETLLKKGILEFKKDIDIYRDEERFGIAYKFHPDRDLLWRIKEI